MKHLSTRFSIVKRSLGHSAVEKASYISRSVLHCEYDGKDYRPKYHEDLVHSEISLPENAPEKYKDRAVLWNSIELAEKGKKAQLARMLKASLPNKWSYEMAEEAVRDYVYRNFVSQGMCADWAVHDSVNGEGQRNLHIHVLLTMRPLTQDGKWGAKQRKVYTLDENGNKIRNWNGKGYKCTTKSTTDWNDRKKGKQWRKDLADTINAVNEQNGIGGYWEYRSFKELGIDREPTVHLGSAADALERKGVRSDRGNINRGIMEQNRILENAENAYKEAVKRVDELKAAVSAPVLENKNEILELIGRVAGEKGRLVLPIVSGMHLRRIRNREALQSPEKAAAFINTRKIGSFEMLGRFLSEKELEWQGLDEKWKSLSEKHTRLEGLLKMYAEYEPCWKVYSGSLELKGFAKLKYGRQHKADIERYPEVKGRMAALLKKDEKLAPEKWRAELKSVEKEMESMRPERAKTATELAYAEVIGYNKSNFEREEANRARQQQRQSHKNKKRGHDISL